MENYKNYKQLVNEEIEEWRRIEKELFKKGIPWWVDLRRAKIKGRNIFWRNDPKKEAIVRGAEKQELINLATLKKGRVLDLGCGSGWLSLELGRRGMNVVGIDVSPERIEIAKRFLRENPYQKNFGQVEYQVGDLNRIAFSENSFDVVVVWDTLHHFPNLNEILIKIQRWLKPAGRFIIYDHVGNKLLKLGSRWLDLIEKKEKGSRIIPYEDVLGKELITLIRKRFAVKYLRTCLSFPVSALLFLIFSRDRLKPFLPSLVRIDRFLCKNRLFLGEYVFISATNEK